MDTNNDGANALLNRQGSRGISWEDIGQDVWVTGKILDHDTDQCRKWDSANKQWSNDLDFYDDGNPKMQIVIDLATDLRDPDNPDDDGHRTLRSGPSKRDGSVIAATKAALAVAGAPGLEYGADYGIRWVSGAGKSGDPRRFEVVYRRPVTPVPSTTSSTPTAPATPSVDNPFAAAPVSANQIL